MKICVVGAGAIGGYMAVRLASAGHDVAVVARGPHLSAIQAQGLRLVEAEQELVAEHLMATDRIPDVGPAGHRAADAQGAPDRTGCR